MNLKTTAIILLAGVQLAGAATITHIATDFAPGAEGYDAEGFPPGWSRDDSGPHPLVVWQNDSERAGVNSNGYFLEGRRDPGGTTVVEARTYLHWAKELKGREFELSFDFKVGTDPEVNNGEVSGILDFRFEQWDTEINWWVTSNLRLALNDDVLVNSAGDLLENIGYESVSFTEPDENGWRRVTVTGDFVADTDVRVFVAPWTFGDANTAAGHFSGSWGVDNVVLNEVLPDLPTPVGITAFPAREVDFFAEIGRRYRIESSTNQKDWTIESENIIGNGQTIRRMFSARDNENKTYRVVTD